MRNLLIAVGLGCVACGGGGANVDTAAVRDSSVIAGPPATLTPPTVGPAESASTSSGAPRRGSTGSSGTTTVAPPTTGAKADSVRGVVSVVGTSFDKHVMVADRATQRRVEIVGTLSSLIGHVAGTEVSVAGTTTGTQLNATRFLVRSVDGQPAIDGTLKTESGSLYIVTAEGTRTRIVAPPPPLVGHDGSRVWITGDPAKSVSSFGFIDPPR